MLRAYERMAATMPKTKALDPLRSYVITLRKGRGLDTEQVAKGTGVKQRTYEAWERGETGSLKLSTALAVIRFLGGAIEHLDVIDDLRSEEAQELAERWLKMSAEDIAAAKANAAQMGRIVALAESDPIRLESLLRELRDDARADPGVIDIITGVLAGRRSARGGD